MSFQLIENGDVYTPTPIGVQSVLLDGDKILKIGPVDAQKLRDMDFECRVIDAKGCYVVPGLIDPHAHILGGGGEEGFTSRMPEVQHSQIIQSGVTTLVGLLGTDTSTRYLSSLHAKASQLWQEGLTCFIYTGGFQVPPETFTGAVMDDLVMIDKVIGAGEIAISDYRWVDPKVYDLAVLATACMVGGKIGGKAGVTHIHVGEGKKRLALLRDLLDNFDVPPACIYPTHITRSTELMEEAIELTRRGCYVDMDTTQGKLGEYIQYYIEHGGAKESLTISSDAHTVGGSPQQFFKEFAACIRDYHMALEEILPFFTSNTARVLKLEKKGILKEQNEADVLVLDKESLTIRHLFSRGKHMIENGEIIQPSKEETQAEESTP